MLSLLRKLQRRTCFIAICALSFTACLWLGYFPGQHSLAQATDPQALVQVGVDQYHGGDFQGAIATWQDALATVDPQNLENQSIILENLARAHHQVGRFSEEIEYWERAIQNYKQLGNWQALGNALTEQAQAYGRLGQHRRAIALLCGEKTEPCTPGSSLQIARDLSDVTGEAAALGSLGESYRLTGNYEMARSVLERGLDIAETQIDNPFYQATVLNSLGDTYSTLAKWSNQLAQSANQRESRREARALTEQAQQQTQQAIEYLQRSYTLAKAINATSIQARAQLSLLPLYWQTAQTNQVTQTWQTAHQLVKALPPSQEKAYTTITLAGYLESPGHLRECPKANVVSQQKQLLETAIKISQTIENTRAESFALGQLGNLYERCDDYSKALTLTQEARHAADQGRSAQDSLYLWDWQRGRILQAQGKTEAAEKAYNQALTVLDVIRSDLLSSNQELQFDFRDRIEPIYREFMTLKLAHVTPSITLASQDQAKIDDVLVTLDSLKLAELQNYFVNDCVIVPTETRVDVVGQKTATATLSTAILGNRTAIIASFPNGQQKLEWIDLTEDEIISEINTFRRVLESNRVRDRKRYKSLAIKLYDQLLRPFEEQLSDFQVEQLVFINDGILRSIPMAALYDGEQYLIEKYAIATTPSLTLTDANGLDRQNLSALILGLSDPSTVGDRIFAPLTKVEDEIETVKQLFPASKVLKNKDFSATEMLNAFKKNNYRILHIATHGNFGAQPQDNFIVTGQKNEDETNKTLTISELDTLIRSVSDQNQDPIDLLTLTACETAVGDNRATLGLAGVAVRAGARSAVASLWAVDDEATANLITRFYHHLLNPDLSKAEALRAAQLEVIQSDSYTQHPFYWAPFILIGNWL